MENYLLNLFPLNGNTPDIYINLNNNEYKIIINAFKLDIICNSKNLFINFQKVRGSIIIGINNPSEYSNRKWKNLEYYLFSEISKIFDRITIPELTGIFDKFEKELLIT